MAEASLSRREWVAPRAPPSGASAALATSLRLPEPFCRLLLSRDLDDRETIRRHLRPTLNDLHPPDALPDFEAAAVRIESAIESGETILVHGDFDADGMCAAALLGRGLGELGARVETFSPHRLRDGYDLSDAGLQRAAEAGATLIVTADCGVTAIDAVRTAAERGIEVIVTDHHRPAAELPLAVAVVDPLREDGGYPFSGLSGVGVALKLLGGLIRRAGGPETARNRHLDLVAIGSIADQVPLVDENRPLVAAGLRVLARTDKAGLRALLAEAGLGGAEDLEAEDVAFRIAPRLNAVGRMADAEAGIRLLETDDPREAAGLVGQATRGIRRRREVEATVLTAAEAMLAGRFDPARDGAAVTWGDDWHPGVIGIVASQLVDRFQRPAVVVAFDGDVGRGSCRSWLDFDVCEALERLSPLLERFGGHRQAAGFGIRRANMERFAADFSRLAADAAAATERAVPLDVDLVLTLADVTPDLGKLIRSLGPFGQGNPAPVIVTEDAAVTGISTVGRGGAHLRAELSDGRGGRLAAFGVGLGPLAAELGARARWDVAYELGRNRWNGRSVTQARLLDVRPAAS
ncbi:MAG: single-stranded-DNA-specific exonuclease RecJ [Gemmatimonadota bacterium]